MIKIWRYGKDIMASTLTNFNSFVRKKSWLILRLEKLPKIYFSAKKKKCKMWINKEYSAKCGQNPPISL